MAIEHVIDGATATVAATGTIGFWRWWHSTVKTKRRREDDRWQKQEQFNEGVKLALISTQHHMIYELCNHHLEAGYITTAALDDLDHLMRGYEAMGGDSTAHTLMERVRHLKIDNSMEPELLRGSYGDEINAKYQNKETV